MIGNNLLKFLKEKETKIMYYLKSKYSSEKIEKMEKAFRGVCSFLIFVNMCTVMLHINVLAKDIEETLKSSDNELTVIISEEDIKTEKIETDTIDNFSNELDALSANDDLDANKENLYVTKRLIVLSNTDEFDTYDASSIVSFGNLYVLQFETEKETEYAYNKLKKLDIIESVEIDSVMESENVSGSDNKSTITQKDTELKKYLDSIEASKEVKIAILDTGVNVNDETLKDRIIDLGINVSSTGDKNSIIDDNGHGTEMATLIANNSNRNVKIMPIKVANENGKATILNVYIGIQKAIENGANVINISMNTVSSASSQILTNIIDEVSDKGVIVVVSAGNDSEDVKNVTPSNIESAIVVSAVNSDNSFASYSNYGETVDYCSYGIYEKKSGTSYAAANVSGVIAEILSKSEEISILDKYIIDLGNDGFDNYYGKGLISLENYEEVMVEDKEKENNSELSNIQQNTQQEVIDTESMSEELQVSAYTSEGLSIDWQGGNATFTDTSLGGQIITGNTISLESGDITIAIKGNYIFKVAGGAGSAGILQNKETNKDITGNGGKGILIETSELTLAKDKKVSIVKGQKVDNYSHNLTTNSMFDGTNNYDAYIKGGGLYYYGTGSATGKTTWYEAAFGRGGNYSSITIGTSTIVAAGGGGGVAYHYAVKNDGKVSESTGKLSGSSVYSDTDDHTDENNSIIFIEDDTSGVWTKLDGTNTCGKSSKKNGNYGGIGSNAVAAGASGQNRVDAYYTNTEKNRYVNFSSYNSKEPYVKMTCNAKYFTVTNPTKEGYIFDGWTTGGSVSVSSSDGTSVTFKKTAGDATLTAKWKPITYSINYYGNGATGGSTASSTHTYGVAKELTANGFTRTGYTFANWNTAANGTGTTYIDKQSVTNLTATEGTIINLYAQWTPITYYIAYNGNGATSGSTATSAHTYDVDKNLTPNGYVRAYTVTYNYNGSGQSNSSATATYTFNGWATSANGAKVYNNAQSVKNLSSTNGAIVTLYANWSFATVTLPTPSRIGYMFAGWYDAASGGNKIGDAGASYTPTANKTLYAQWTPITYYIAYNGNGATSGSTATSTHTYDVAKNLTPNGYVRAYTVTYNYNGSGQSNSTDTATYIFNGWATSEKGAKVYNNEQSVINLSSTQDATIMLYANWSSTSVTLPLPSRTGHNFIGWYDEATGGNKIGDAGTRYTPTVNTTLYSHWEPWTLNTNINLIDSETKNTIHENANFKVYEYNKGTGKYDTFVMDLTQRTDKTYITSNFLTYSDTNLGKFRIIEETAPYGYYGDWLDSTETQKNYYDINIEEIIRTQNYSGQTVADKGTINITIENTRTEAKVDVNIIDTETKSVAQADATLEGAVYGIYAKENIIHADGVTGILYKQGSLVQRATIENGKLLYKDLELGEYYIQQITPPNGYTEKDTKYYVSLPYEGEKVELVERSVTVEEKVNKQAFQLIKVGNVGDNDEFETLEGAGFKIYLISSLSRVKNGEIVPNANGTYDLDDFKDYDFSVEETAIDYTNKSEGENISEIFTDESGYLLSPELAYGQYIVYESTVPEERVEIKPFFVTIDQDNRTPKKLRVFYDAEFTAKIQVIKKDAKTSEVVLKANAQYRILNKETNEYVEQWITYPSKLLLGTEENPYTTDETGTMTTPLTLSVGEYELQEVTAPEGYVLVGNEGKSQQGTYISTSKENISFKISKTMVMEFDEDTKEAIIKVEQYNEEQLGSLTIDVSGEYLSGYSKDNNQNYKFDYQVRPIPGVEFTLYAKYNIYSQDNQKDIVYNKDEIVKTVYSDDEGKCIIDNLPLGIYYIKQTQTVNGFVLNKEIKEVEITYEGQEKAVVYRNVNYNNDRQKVEITLLKRDIETNERLSGAKFALYTKENINYIDLNGMAQTINADEMIYEVTTDENGIAKWKYGENVDLPLGMYYIKEVKAPEGYVTNNNIIDINAKYRGQHEDVIENNQEFTNQKTKVMIIKQDVETKNALSDVEMKLLNSNREELYSWTTDETGQKEILKLQPGETYILQEIKPRENYINEMIIGENQNNIAKIEDSELEEITFKVSDVLEEQNIIVGNKSKVGNINIIKKGDVLVGTETDYEGNINFKYTIQNLAGAEYEIYAKNDIVHPDGHIGVIISAGTKVANSITTIDGILVTNIDEQLLATYPEEVQKMLQRGLPLGEYEIKEIKAPEGYYIDEQNSTKEVTLEENETNDEIINVNRMFINRRVFINLADTNDEEKVGIYKYDEETKEPIQNAVFGIYNAEDIVENGNVILEKDTLILKGKTDKNGQIKSKIKLPLGKYYIKEIEAANGYEYKDEKVEMDFSNVTENQEIYNMYVEISNKQTEVNILKTDVEENPITGAILQLQDAEGNVLEQWNSTEEAYNIRALETEKEYKINEIEPAEGYVTEEEKYFSLDKYGNIVTDENNLYNEDTIIMKDEKTKIQITVVDEKTEEELIGVHVQIVDKETNEIVYEFDTTEEKTIIEGLPIGDYDVIQKTETDGYVTTHNTITIEDKEGVQEKDLKQIISKLSIKVKDTEENKYINAQKIEIKDKETGNVIASTEKEQEDILIIEKTEDGYYVERLPIKDYELEVEVLEGYKEIDKKTITIEDTEELQEIEVETRKLRLDMRIEKYLGKISIDNKEQNFDKNNISKIEIRKKLINKAQIELEYIIKVTNMGEIAGNIGKIVEEMPDGMQFVKNQSDSAWKQEGNTLVSTEYADKELQVGESKEYKVVLKWINGKNNFGSKVNNARLEGITNNLNYKDNNEKDNNSSVVTLFTVATGSDAKIIKEVIYIVFFAIIVIGTLSIIEIKIFDKRK